MSKIDERIRKDLGDIYSKKVPTVRTIKRAQSLNASVVKKVEDCFSSRGLPSYFYGDRKAKMVIVHLNPGAESEKQDKEFYAQTRDFNRSTLATFIKSYKSHMKNFGVQSQKSDEFDVKQAAFISAWEKSGMSFKNINFKCKLTEEQKLAAMKEVLSKKLQLELIPYASRQFDEKMLNLDELIPYLMDIIDEIFCQKRRYVVFMGRIFERLLQSDKLKKFIKVDFAEEKLPQMLLKKKKASCRVVIITYKKKKIKALIAHTFADKSLCRDFKRMRKYGEFCYKHFKSK